MIQKDSKRFQKNPKDSKRIQKIPKESERFQKNPKDFKRVQKIQKNSKELISKQYFKLKELATAQKANGSSPSSPSRRIKD